MKQKLRLIISATLTVAALTAAAGASDFNAQADKLKAINLFQGTNQGYDLDRTPTRAEAATMLVRMLGKENEAKALNYTAPFTDLNGWEKPYVQYLYNNGLIAGSSDTEFAPNDECSAQMYTSMLLRALGYSESNGDFTYDNAIDFARTTGLVDDFNCDESNFLRDHVVAMSYTALHTPTKGSDVRLLTQLIEGGTINENDAAPISEFFDNVDAVQNLGLEANDIDMTLNFDADFKANGKSLIDVSLPLDIKVVDSDDASKIQAAVTTDLGSSDGSAPIEFYCNEGTIYLNLLGLKCQTELPEPEVITGYDDTVPEESSETDTDELVLAEDVTPIADNDVVYAYIENNSIFPVCALDSISYVNGTYTAKPNLNIVNKVFDEEIALVKESLVESGSLPEDIKIDGIDINLESASVSATLLDGMLNKLNIESGFSVTAPDFSANLNASGGMAVNALDEDVSIAFPEDLKKYKKVDPSIILDIEITPENIFKDLDPKQLAKDLNLDKLLKNLDSEKILANLNVEKAFEGIDLEKVINDLNLDKLDLEDVDASKMTPEQQLELAKKFVSGIDAEALAKDLDLDTLLSNLDVDKAIKGLKLVDWLNGVDLDKFISDLDLDSIFENITSNGKPIVDPEKFNESLSQLKLNEKLKSLKIGETLNSLNLNDALKNVNKQLKDVNIAEVIDALEKYLDTVDPSVLTDAAK